MEIQEFAVGQVFTSPTKTVNDAHFLFFSGLTGDNHPIHYDVEYAKSTRFGKPLAHGLLLASLTALGGTDGSRSAEGLVFFEQGSRFLKPVTIGDTVHSRCTVARIWQEGKRRFIRFDTALINQRAETVLEGFHVYQIIPRRQDNKGNGGNQA
jgi:3-hydroxybutyryl-CoA dehydratase